MHIFKTSTLWHGLAKCLKQYDLLVLHESLW